MMPDKLRTVVIGAGLMGETHLEAAAETNAVDFVGVINRSPARGEALAKKHGIPSFTTLDDAVKALNPQAADICIPTPFHVDAVKQCAGHKLNTLCEKPIALSLEDAQAMRQVGIDTGTRVMIAHVLRFWPEYIFARQAVLSGDFGDLLAVDCWRLSAPPPWNDWMMDEKMSGGAVVDLQIHDMDFVFQLLGKPDRIIAMGASREGAVNEVWNTLEYPNPLPVRIYASFAMPPSYPFRMFFSLRLEHAVLEMDFLRPKNKRLIIYPDSGEPYHPEIATKDAYAAQLDYFAGRIIADEPFAECPIEESITALEMCLASKQSCRSGTPVDL